MIGPPGKNLTGKNYLWYRAGEIIILGDNMRNNNDDFFNGVAEQIKKRENDEEEDFDRVWNEPWVERKGEKSWNRQHKKW